MRDAGRINAQDKGLDSFGPRETSSGNNPTCCLRLGLIMITGESPGTGSRCLALEIVSCSLFGVPCPSLYKLEGRVTCGVLVGLGLVYLFLQVEDKAQGPEGRLTLMMGRLKNKGMTNISFTRKQDPDL